MLARGVAATAVPGQAVSGPSRYTRVCPRGDSKPGIGHPGVIESRFRALATTLLVCRSHHTGNSRRRVRRHGVAYPLAPCAVGQDVEFQKRLRPRSDCSAASSSVVNGRSMAGRRSARPSDTRRPSRNRDVPDRWLEAISEALDGLTRQVSKIPQNVRQRPGRAQYGCGGRFRRPGPEWATARRYQLRSRNTGSRDSDRALAPLDRASWPRTLSLPRVTQPPAHVPGRFASAVPQGRAAPA